jgi:hypothetical protein
MNIIALIVAVAAAVAAFLTWRASKDQFEASDCPVLALTTKPEQNDGVLSQQVLRGGVSLPAISIPPTVQNFGHVAAVWWGWRWEPADPAVRCLIPLGFGEPMASGACARLTMLDIAGFARDGGKGKLSLVSQGPSGTEWLSVIQIENSRQISLEMRRQPGSRARFEKSAAEHQAKRKEELTGGTAK